MNKTIKEELIKIIGDIKRSGLYKKELIIETPQKIEIKVSGNKKLLNFCANNYLGLANHPEIIKVAHKTLDKWGYGMSSVRFISGTLRLHKKLEEKITGFLKGEDTILYAACFDANGGIFETLLDENSSVISDELNHASIIDGIRLCKARRFRYKHSDMQDLEEKLKEAAGSNRIIIVTDGVFSMDGDIAKLDQINILSQKYNTLLMVDESHATGVIGKTGRGSIEYHNLLGKIDIISGTLGKALGGASGGFITGRKEIIELLRQCSRPYLFSNTLAPVVAGTSIAAIDLLSRNQKLLYLLQENAYYFRSRMTSIGFKIKEGFHPIVPIMLFDEKLSQYFAKDLYDQGIFAVGFFYPVVPKGQARIRIQISAAHKKAHLDKAIKAFEKTGKKYKII